MPISHKHKILFIHIPKCGGTSIEIFFHMLKEELMYIPENTIINDNVEFSRQHLTPKYLKTFPLTKDIYDQYYKFTIIRNPYDRVLSEYKWLHRDKISKEHFEKWLYSFYENIDSDHKLSQCDYIYDEDGNITVDQIIRLENINVEFKQLLCNINYKGNNTLKKHNISNSNKYSHFLTEEHKDFIYNLYKEDFIKLGYGK